MEKSKTVTYRRMGATPRNQITSHGELVLNIAHLRFGFISDFGFRISDFSAAQSFASGCSSKAIFYA
jgi:hypothetical protein